ncbi:GNAT family N-acetyltransferase [Sporolactobacillus pectinivorans]|uniref:GNAT family N-acetyltransferase n=1 Tax=Sporolactobacillus pectinivorans TaxID=1591408 RepID=UPI000C2562AA|nr:GNAT family N-acetyltransferase [Sporolactobacillus pectinivorans]
MALTFTSSVHGWGENSLFAYENKEERLSAFSLDLEHWDDFVALFGDKGACGGCWCMSWRLAKSDFDANKGESNKQKMKALVTEGQAVGILLYRGKEPIGWCAAAPREQYIRLNKSRVFRRIDDLPVWSISCFFLSKRFRRRGLSYDLVKAAVNFCQMNGAEIIEAYPEVPYSDKEPGTFLWTGIPASFEKAGFVETVRRSKWKRMMRLQVNKT